MNLKKFALATWTLLGVALLINACGGSSVAAGPSVAPSIFIMAKNDKHAFSLVYAARLHPRRSMLAFIMGDAYAATAPSTCPAGSIGTLTGRGGSPFGSNIAYGVSCTQTYFGVDTSTGDLAGLDPGQAVLFSQVGCAGTGYVSPDVHFSGTPSIVAGAVIQSGVFYENVSGNGDNDANNYFYLPPNAQAQNISTASAYIAGIGCQLNLTASSNTMYQLQPNTVQASGENSAPVPLPINTGTGT